ncbi:hypothetical protein PAMA_013358 [Pampus argenteus]
MAWRVQNGHREAISHNAPRSPGSSVSICPFKLGAAQNKTFITTTEQRVKLTWKSGARILFVSPHDLYIRTQLTYLGLRFLPRCLSEWRNSLLIDRLNSSRSERLLVRVEEAFKETLQQACEGVGRSRHADWGHQSAVQFFILIAYDISKVARVSTERQRKEEREKKCCRGYLAAAVHVFYMFKWDAVEGNGAVTGYMSVDRMSSGELPIPPPPLCFPPVTIGDRQGPSHFTHPASNIHIFFFCGKSLFAQAMQRCFSTTDSAPVSAPPPLDSINSPYNRDDKGSGRKGKNNEAPEKRRTRAAVFVRLNAVMNSGVIHAFSLLLFAVHHCSASPTVNAVKLKRGKGGKADTTKKAAASSSLGAHRLLKDVHLGVHYQLPHRPRSPDPLWEKQIPLQMCLTDLDMNARGCSCVVPENLKRNESVILDHLDVTTTAYIMFNSLYQPCQGCLLVERKLCFHLPAWRPAFTCLIEDNKKVPQTSRAWISFTETMSTEKLNPISRYA